MKINTTRFGTIDVNEDQVITLAEGMLGFSECSRYVMMDDEIGEPFMWMQSLDVPSLACVVIDPAMRCKYSGAVAMAGLEQLARNLTDSEDGLLRTARWLIHDDPPNEHRSVLR